MNSGYVTFQLITCFSFSALSLVVAFYVYQSLPDTQLRQNSLCQSPLPALFPPHVVTERAVAHLLSLEGSLPASLVHKPVIGICELVYVDESWWCFPPVMQHEQDGWLAISCRAKVIKQGSKKGIYHWHFLTLRHLRIIWCISEWVAVTNLHQPPSLWTSHKKGIFLCYYFEDTGLPHTAYTLQRLWK